MFPFGRAVRSGRSVGPFGATLLRPLPNCAYCFSRAARNLFVFHSQSAPLPTAYNVPFGAFQCSHSPQLRLKTRPKARMICGNIKIARAYPRHAVSCDGACSRRSCFAMGFHWACLMGSKRGGLPSPRFFTTYETQNDFWARTFCLVSRRTPPLELSMEIEHGTGTL